MAKMAIIQRLFLSFEPHRGHPSKRQEADIFTSLRRPSAGHHGHLYSEEHDQPGHKAVTQRRGFSNLPLGAN